MIAFCGCSATKNGVTTGAIFQDSIYGKGKRVFNSCQKGHKCTICGETKSFSKAEEKESKKDKAVEPKKK